MIATAGAVVSWSDEPYGNGYMRLFQVSYTTHASAGTFTCVTPHDITGWIHEVETDPAPSTPQPDDNYGITLKNSNGRDVMGGAMGTNRDETNTEMTKPIVNSVWQEALSDGPLTIAVTAAGNSKAAELLIYYEPV